jgi:hypothetical protein
LLYILFLNWRINFSEHRREFIVSNSIWFILQKHKKNKKNFYLKQKLFFLLIPDYFLLFFKLFYLIISIEKLLRIYMINLNSLDNFSYNLLRSLTIALLLGLITLVWLLLLLLLVLLRVLRALEILVHKNEFAFFFFFN